jgi:hypothetical protein
MKKVIPVLAAVILLIAAAIAEETVFRDIQFPSSTGKLANASLTFSDETKAITVRVADDRVITIPYGQIEKFSYEYTKKHRLKQGAAVALLSPGTGIIIAFTKSKSHWLDIDYREQNAPTVLVLRLDKRDYQKVCDAAKVHTGKEVAMLGKTTTQSIKAKIKD